VYVSEIATRRSGTQLRKMSTTLARLNGRLANTTSIEMGNGKRHDLDHWNTRVEDDSTYRSHCKSTRSSAKVFYS
jgi:hypothetical protein